MKKSFVLPLVLASAGLASGQTGATKPAEKPSSINSAGGAQAATAPAANPNDVSSMSSILAALYDVISGPKGKKRDWDRFRSLFISEARLIPSGKRPNGEIGHTVLGVEGYITRSSRFLEDEGFFEREVARKVEQWGNIAHVFSTYESRHKLEEEKPFSRGINSIQLLNDGKRWWIVTVYWESESTDNPLPAKYLKSEGGQN
jgi:hypothetical protein